MARGFRSSLTLAVLFLVLSSGLAGWFVSLDNVLRSARFSLSSHKVTGDIVFVDIDTASLDHVGVWPWPRGVYADIVDALVAADAADIFFDVDFSAVSNEAEDAKFERALDAAGGYVQLATFLQPTRNAGEFRVNRPIERFAQYAQLVSVNVPIDDDGVVRFYTSGFETGGEFYPSAAAALVPEYGNIADKFMIDYGIDAGSIERVAVSDILDGKLDPRAVAGKRIVVGASALELRDTHTMPRYGAMPGVLVHLLAAETLLQNRVIHPASNALSVLIALFLAGILGYAFRRAPIAVSGAAVALVSVSLEFSAFVLQSQSAIALDTVVIHASVFAFSIVVVVQRAILVGRQLEKAWRAHAATKDVLNRVIADNFDGVIVVQQSGKIIICSQLAEDLLGYRARNGLVGEDALDVLPPVIGRDMALALSPEEDDWVAGELRQLSVVLEDEVTRVIEYVVTVSSPETSAEAGLDEDERVACLTFRDVTDRMAAQNHLQFIAEHDMLTGALSRIKFIDVIDVAMSEPQRRSNGVTVFLVGLSRFKTVNDTLGHTNGDKLLKQVANRLAKSGVNCVARLGGDVFAVVRSGVYSDAGLEAFCQSVLDVISAPYDIGEHKAIIGAKIGSADSNVSGFDVETLLSHADMAMSVAKGLPGNNFAIYQPAMSERLEFRQNMEVALRNALERDEFYVTYQPQVNLVSGELIGVEALVRWHHPEMGAVSPAEFIPIAEETGVILELGRWILRTACEEALHWPSHIKLAVNVSPMQFEFGDVVGDVVEILEETGFPVSRLDVEITEGIMISNPELITASLHKLREMGLRVALDDFGTGYSSLSYLGKLPIDKIKIDRSFVKGLPNDQESGAIVRAIMSLSESLGKSVVAEGIETADQAWVLRLAGAQIGQGFYYGHGLRANELEARIAATTTGRAWAVAV